MPIDNNRGTPSKLPRMNRNQNLFTEILNSLGPVKVIELTISAFSTLNKVNDYFLEKVETLERQECYTLNANNQLAYSFTPEEMHDYNVVFARCKVMLHLFEFTLDLHEQDILDEYGPDMGQYFEENRVNMGILLDLGQKWIIKSESNDYSADLELNTLENLVTENHSR